MIKIAVRFRLTLQFYLEVLRKPCIYSISALNWIRLSPITTHSCNFKLNIPNNSPSQSFSFVLLLFPP